MESFGFIPEKFYVTRKMESAENVLGFMQPMHAEGLSKRKQSADKWAASNYGRGQYATFDPIEIDNEPAAGFALVDFARRYTTSNVVWRLIHPMGFEFEITSENFDYLIRHTTIQRGVVTDMCAFIREGGHNVLIPVASEKYIASKTQKQYFTKMDKTDFGIGSVVKLKADTYEYVYYGAYHIMTEEHVIEDVMAFNSNYNVMEHVAVDTDPASKRIHVLRARNCKYSSDRWTYTAGAPSVVEVVDTQELTEEDAYTAVVQAAQSNSLKYKYKQILAVQHKPFKMSKLKSVRVPVITEYDDRAWGAVFLEKDGEVFSLYTNASMKHNGNTVDVNVYKTNNIAANGLSELFAKRLQCDRQYSYSAHYYTPVIHEVVPVSGLTGTNVYSFSSMKNKSDAASLIINELEKHGYTNLFTQWLDLK